MSCRIEFWGIPDTSIRFCEKKYNNHEYIAEYYNTFSSIIYLLVALPYIFGKTRNISISCMGIGIGSIIMHGSMRYYGQWIDELSILLYSYHMLRYLEKNMPPFWPALITLYFLEWKNFQYFMTMLFFMQIRIYYDLININKIRGIISIIINTIGSILWFYEQIWCEQVQDYYFHMYWHFCTAISILWNFSIISKFTLID